MCSACHLRPRGLQTAAKKSGEGQVKATKLLAKPATTTIEADTISPRSMGPKAPPPNHILSTSPGWRYPMDGKLTLETSKNESANKSCCRATSPKSLRTTMCATASRVDNRIKALGPQADCVKPSLATMKSKGACLARSWVEHMSRPSLRRPWYLLCATRAMPSDGPGCPVLFFHATSRRSSGRQHSE